MTGTVTSGTITAYLVCPGCNAHVPLGAPHACATHSWAGACDRCAALEAKLAEAERAERERCARVLAGWARSRWDAEVKHRPSENVHRRTLDVTWRQVERDGPVVLMAGELLTDLNADMEARRWQDRIESEIVAAGLEPLDASGNESGDPLDWTTDQVRRALDDAKAAAEAREKARQERFEAVAVALEKRASAVRTCDPTGAIAYRAAAGAVRAALAAGKA